MGPRRRGSARRRRAGGAGSRRLKPCARMVTLPRPAVTWRPPWCVDARTMRRRRTVEVPGARAHDMRALRRHRRPPPERTGPLMTTAGSPAVCAAPRAAPARGRARDPRAGRRGRLAARAALQPDPAEGGGGREACRVRGTERPQRGEVAGLGGGARARVAGRRPGERVGGGGEHLTGDAHGEGPGRRRIVEKAPSVVDRGGASRVQVAPPAATRVAAMADGVAACGCGAARRRDGGGPTAGVAARGLRPWTTADGAHERVCEASGATASTALATPILAHHLGGERPLGDRAEAHRAPPLLAAGERRRRRASRVPGRRRSAAAGPARDHARPAAWTGDARLLSGQFLTGLPPKLRMRTHPSTPEQARRATRRPNL